MAIVNTALPITSQSCQEMIRQLVDTYSDMRTEVLGRTAFQRPISSLVLGSGERQVLYSAAHHANEWITSLVLLKYAEDLAQAARDEGQIYNRSARELLERVTIHIVPMVDPDGVDLVVGAISQEDVSYALAQRISRDFPDIPFPEGWKANLLGTDLNLNYPAGWLMAREIKFSQGYTQPAPRDYVGRAPINQLETQILAAYTEEVNPDLVLAYHSQGKEIYWEFRNYQVPGAQELGEQMSQASGYVLAQAPYNSSFAGYKDWFIQNFRKPGYTIEVGQGENPLPLSQFDEIYQDNLGILTIAALDGA